jgi:hypothetical protein
MAPVIIGNATLYCGDCLEILPTLPKVDAVITDPPWRASDGSRILRRPGDGLGVAPSKRSTSLRYGSIGHFDADIIASLPKVASNDVLVLCGYMELGDVVRALSPIRGVLVWHNTRATPIPGAIACRDVAFFVWGGINTNAGKNGYRWPSCLFAHGSPQGGCMAVERILEADGSTAHPAQEPLDLFIAVMQPISGVILDPYMGTATTGAACMNLGRKFIGIEIEPKYFDIACERIENAQRQLRMFA